MICPECKGSGEGDCFQEGCQYGEDGACSCGRCHGTGEVPRRSGDMEADYA